MVGLWDESAQAACVALKSTEVVNHTEGASTIKMKKWRFLDSWEQ